MLRSLVYRLISKCAIASSLEESEVDVNVEDLFSILYDYQRLSYIVNKLKLNNEDHHEIPDCPSCKEFTPGMYILKDKYKSNNQEIQLMFCPKCGKQLRPK